ncbi:MAG: NAD(P)/FAD-dependent oxidoreductase [Candidatus Bathyarchaeota archaeon]|nr:NAD(P)/FAD-dependent oxidoreductase [Candidatus Bathyarchaeota archaeon]
MQKYYSDVLIVGAGPAGSMAAKTAAERGVDVIFIEEHEVPGTPVYCAEGLGLDGIRAGGLEPVPPFIAQEIKTAQIIAPNGISLDMTSENITGYTLDRQVFDKALADNAVEAGAKLMTKTRAMDVIWDKKQIIGVKAQKNGEEIEFYAQVVIGADGHWSVIRRRAGLTRYFSDYLICAQYQLGGLDLEDPTINEFYLGMQYAPGGYGWVFPKSNKVANVGVGIRIKHQKAAIEYLKDFIGNDPRFRNAKILNKTGGICPVSGTIEKYIMDGLMLVGDAAGMLIPMTGAGIHTGIESGKMAGRIASEAIKEGDVSEARLLKYKVEFDQKWGKHIKESGRVMEMLDRFNDDDLNTLSEIVTKEDILAMANGVNVKVAMAGIVKRSPRKLIQLIRAYLR